MTAEYVARLSACLLAESPSHVVLLGEPALRHAGQIAAFTEAGRRGETRITALTTAEVNRLFSGHDLCGATRGAATALLSVYDDVEGLDRLLGEASRRFTDTLIVEHLWCDRHGRQRESLSVRPVSFFAFGFHRVCLADGSSPPATCYRYSLREYKPAPDWLNARFWAHPERFDLDVY